MIAYLKGTLSAADAYSCIVEVGGVGYQMLMSSKALASLPPCGRECLVYTYLQVKDDGVTMFGFKDAAEKSMFMRLINVSGIGPKMALAALSTYAPAELADVISQGDVAAVVRVPGIGKKTAQRVILELQGVLKTNDAVASQKTGAAGTALADATAALQSMGFTAEEITAAFKDVPVDGKDVSALIRMGLKALGGR